MPASAGACSGPRSFESNQRTALPLGTTVMAEHVRDRESPTWPIFICYRQDDGKDAARWLAHHLNRLRLTFVPDGYDAEPQLDVYFDETAPAVDDWTKVHGPALERSRALILVCSPGAFADFGERDWVQREIRWWIDHRTSAPVLIDSTGAEDRWVPHVVRDKWPQAQRTKVLPLEWARLPIEEREAQESRVLERIVGGIRASEIAVRYEDLERQRQLTSQLASQSQRLRRQLRWLIAAAAVAILLAGMATVLGMTAAKSAKMARLSAADAVAAMQRVEKTNAELRDTLVWVFNEAAHVPFDRFALTPEASRLVLGTAQRLRATGYTGSITLEGHLARFCVRYLHVSQDHDEPELADPDMPFSRCEFYPSTSEYMLALGDRQAASLRDLLQSAGFSAGRIKVVSYGAERPEVAPPLGAKTAGEWNRIARQNNRVVLRLGGP